MTILTSASDEKKKISVEFGAKCNNILVDGISFIEKLSFNAFNEGTRLGSIVITQTIKKAESSAENSLSMVTKSG